MSWVTSQVHSNLLSTELSHGHNVSNFLQGKTKTITTLKQLTGLNTTVATYFPAQMSQCPKGIFSKTFVWERMLPLLYLNQLIILKL